MLILLSPAKKQYLKPLAIPTAISQPSFQDEIKDLVHLLRHKTTEDLQKMMQISVPLSEANYDRFQLFNEYDYTKASSVLSQLQGDAYQSLDATSLDHDDLLWAQEHLIILSGLYGILRPLDAMHPYRLEMKTKLAIGDHRDLYQFWGHKLMNHLEAVRQKTQSTCIINLASNEYSKAVLPKGHALPVIDIQFKDLKAGAYKTIGLFAKRARGAMARAIITEKMTQTTQLKSVCINGYQYQDTHSSDTVWVYHRD